MDSLPREGCKQIPPQKWQQLTLATTSDFADERCMVFAAAVALCRLRGSDTKVQSSPVFGSFMVLPTSQGTRMCMTRTKPSHRVAEDTVVHCSGCHAKRCYKHILSTYTIHSSLALMVHHVHHSSNTWHCFHQDFKDAYAKEYAKLKMAVKHGMEYPLSHLLAYYASEFVPAAPINKAVKLGFYDIAISSDDGVSFYLFTF